jgi:RimJ/RimL family protein N-acetyltransferase
VVEVRAATAADDGALAAIDRATWSWLSSPLPPPAADAAFFNERTKPGDVLVAVADGRVVGYVKVARWNQLESTDHVRMILGLVVDPTVRRRGIGRALVDAAVERARGQGARRLRLHVFGPNEAARRLYESAGFAVEGVLRGEFFLNGQYVDDICMALDLSPVVS